MKNQINANQVYLLMNESSITNSNKKIIAKKINNIINFMNTLNSNNTPEKSSLSIINNTLATELKSTAKLVVKKNNLLSKNLIKSISSQKENLLQVLEISQLRLEAQLKTLNEEMSYPALKTETSFFSKFFSLIKVPFKNTKTKKHTSSINTTREKINLTTSKLTTLEKQKEDLVKEFGSTGTESLRYLNKFTLNAFLPASDVSNNSLEKLKNKISILN